VKTIQCGFISLLLVVGTLFAETMQDRLPLLKQGEEIIFDFHQSITAIGIISITDRVIKVRTATATKDILSREHFQTWLEWFNQGAPGAVSDETFLLRTDETPVDHADDTKGVRWLLTLLKLPLTKIPDAARRRAGPPPSEGEIDLRPLFQPKITVQGKAIDSKSDAFSTHWPDDGSDLSSRLLILYFPRSPLALQTFPYWIESPSSSYHVHVLDSLIPSQP
jgi:hypothetical protein